MKTFSTRNLIGILMAGAFLAGCPSKSSEGAGAAASATPPPASASAAPSASAAEVEAGPPPADTASAAAAALPAPSPAAVTQTPATEDFEDNADTTITPANAAAELNQLEREIGR